MIIDEPDFDNAERLRATACALERGETVLVYVVKRFDNEHSYRNWLQQILHERGHTDESAQVLACGASILFERCE